MFYLKLFTLMLLVLTWQKAWAWGEMGHMVVAQVAENNLSVTAKNSISMILKGQSLAQVSNWADSIKGDPQWAHSKPWHYVDIPDGRDYSTVEHSHEGDVVSAITEMVRILKDQGRRQLDKEIALKFIVHLFGDIHQPLHVGRPEDQGGNALPVIFEGRSTNLHALWDSGMIAKLPMNHVQYAAHLESRSFRVPPYDLREITFSQIIYECMEARKYVYAFNSRSEPIILDAAYSNRNLALMNAQLLMGGKRLAVLLNSLFGR